MFKTKNTRRPRKPAWFIARAAFVVAVLFFAGLTAFYWAKPSWSDSMAFAIVLAIGFLLSAIVTPTVVPKLAHARGFTLAGLATVCIVFGTIDSVGFSGAAKGLENDLTQKAFDADLATYTASKSALEIELSAYKQELKDVRSKFGVNGEIKRASSLEIMTEDLEAERDRVQGELASLVYPVREDRWNDTAIFVFSFLVQFALAIGLLTLEAAREAIYRRELEAYEAKLASDRKARKRAKPKAKPSPVFKPHLVAAND